MNKQLLRFFSASLVCFLFAFSILFENQTHTANAQCIFGISEGCILSDDEDDAPIDNDDEATSDDDDNSTNNDDQSNPDEDDEDVNETVEITESSSSNTDIETSAIQITRLSFPDKVNVRTVGSGVIHYEGAQDGTARLVFDVVDGRYQHASFNAARDTETGSIRFSLQCTDYAQQLKLRVMLEDQSGQRSQPQLLEFMCGQPKLFNLSEELSDPGIAVAEKARVHVFIINDGTTSLGENFVATQDAALSRLDPQLELGVRQTLLQGVNGIWDQCGFAFELGLIKVLHPQQLDAYNLRMNSGDPFTPMSRAVYVPATGPNALSILKQTVYQHLHEQTDGVRQDDLMVFVTGKAIHVQQFAGDDDDRNSTINVEGVSDMVGLRGTLIKWGALFEHEPGKFVLPRQVTSTLSHELGHLISLQHPGQDGSTDTVRDQYNLMKGSGVTPEPRANLLPSQCSQAVEGTVHLRQVAANTAQADEEKPATQTEASQAIGEETADGPTVQFLNLSDEQAVNKTILIEVSANRFEALDQFGFAEFSYSADDASFREIGIDRDPSDGFSTVWDTTQIDNGRYLIRARVSDAARMSASTEIWVWVSNGLITNVDLDNPATTRQIIEAPPPNH